MRLEAVRLAAPDRQQTDRPRAGKQRCGDARTNAELEQALLLRVLGLRHVAAVDGLTASDDIGEQVVVERQLRPRRHHVVGARAGRRDHTCRHVLCEDDRIDVSDLPLGMDASKERSGREAELPSGLTLQELEHRYILQTLARVRNNRTQTAKLLGISLRSLQYKLKSYRQDSLDPMTPFDRAREIESSVGI